MAIKAAIEAAEEDGFFLDISNPCAGCCSKYEVTLGSRDEWEDLDI